MFNRQGLAGDTHSRIRKMRGEGYHAGVHDMLDARSHRSDRSEADSAEEERVAKIGAANTYAAGADTVCAPSSLR